MVARLHGELLHVRLEATFRLNVDLVVARQQGDCSKRTRIRVHHVQHSLVDVSDIDLRRLERFGRRDGPRQTGRPLQRLVSCRAPWSSVRCAGAEDQPGECDSSGDLTATDRPTFC